MNAGNEIKKILFLWSPLADYSVACFRKLSERKDLELYIIYQPGEKDAPYNQFDLSFFKKAIPYNKDGEKELSAFCLSLSPHTIFMSSWNYKFYMAISKKSKQAGTQVISTFDGQWRGTLKQHIGILVSSFFLKPVINNFFVPGDRQAVFARKLGYKNPFLGYYSAYTERFKDSTAPAAANRFIFVGRLVPVKGIAYMIEAYKEYYAGHKDPWPLVVVGKGELRSLCENVPGVELKEFIQPADLPGTLANATCLLLPSLFEPWALVIHEAVTSGLSVICSHECGASTLFVRDGENGYIINTEKDSLVKALNKMSAHSTEKINRMSATSRVLGSLWTTEKWADYVCTNIISAKPVPAA